MTELVRASAADAWVGVGPRFPLIPDPVTKAMAYVTGMDLIRQSVTTDPRHRTGRADHACPAFGCGLRRYLMEPNTAAVRTAMTEAITSGAPAVRAADPADGGAA